jgi:hypothetical protein
MSLQVIERNQRNQRSRNVVDSRVAAAKRIKVLMEKWASNTLALGAELARARETFPTKNKRPHERIGFRQWARKTTGLSFGHITGLLWIHYKFGSRAHDAQLLGSQVLRTLATSKVPESARIEALDRAKKGERLTARQAKKIVQKHKLPGPKKANEQAREEGRPVLASDGFIYFGATEQQAKEGEDRRTMVYGVKRALDHLGNIHLTGRQFLAYALPHQLWSDEQAAIIKRALRWLNDLNDAWGARE